MFKLALRNLWTYKKRLLTSAFAVVLGVSFLTGSFIFTDTLKGLFTDLFSSSVKNVDAVVRGPLAFDIGNAGGPYDEGRGLLDVKLRESLAAIDGVAAVSPEYQGYAQLINPKGKLVKTGGAPTFGRLWNSDPELSAYKLFSGRAPAKPDEVVLDRSLIKTTKYKVGDTVKVNTTAGVLSFVVVGDATFGSSDSALGATTVFFEPARGLELMSKPGQVQGFTIRAKEGVASEELVRRMDAAMVSSTSVNGGKLEIVTGAAYDKELQGFVNTIFNGIKTFFTAFAGIALFVSIFVIANSFSIVIAQRNREMAMLRAIGASRRQVLLATAIEALLVGLVASAVGLLGGLGVSKLIQFALEKLSGGDGSGLPSSGFVIKPTTIILGFAVGTGVTLLSSVLPAIRASRIKPLAAIRDAAVDRSGSSKVRLYFGLALLAVAAVFFGIGITGTGNPAAQKIGVSAAATLIAVVFLGPVIARPITNVLGRTWFGYVVIAFGGLVAIGGVAAVVFGAITTSPLLVPLGLLLILIGVYLVRTGWSSRDVSGQIARQNAIRNPTRTAATALALTIGTAVVCATLVLAQSINNAFSGTLEKTVKADFVVTSGTDFGFPIAVEDSIRKTPGVSAVSGFRVNRFQLGAGVPAVAGTSKATATTTAEPSGRTRGVGVVEAAALTSVLDLGEVEGDLVKLTALDTVAIDKKAASDNGFAIGQKIPALFTNGAKAELEVVALYDNAEGLGNTYYLVGDKTGQTYIPGEVLNFLYIKSDGKDEKAFLKAAESRLAKYPAAEVKTKDTFAKEQLGQLRQILSIITALLLLAIIIAILGIANTLRLSVFERIREIGLLRAIGMSRDQIRACIRWEAIVVATLGAFLGMAIGTLFGSAIVHVLRDGGIVKLQLPFGQLIGLTLCGSIVGLYAARKPASDAAKMNILKAIATE